MVFQYLFLFIAMLVCLVVSAKGGHHEPAPSITTFNISTAVCKPTKKVLWFMAVQSYTKAVESKYYNYVLAAVNSARVFAPSLAPFLIHDGADEDIPAAVRNASNVRLVSHKLTFLANLTRGLGERTMIGAWYRFDIPYVVKNLLTDLNPDEYDLAYALYTDTDVLFFKDFNECSLPKPKVLYIGPEGGRGSQSNSGVLYMNLSAMQTHWPRVLELAVKRNFHFSAVDQGLFLEYFVGGKYSTLLPDRFNWKGYWGGDEDVVIAHFHGPKPGPCLDCLLLNREDFRSFCECPPVYCSVYSLTVDRGSFYRRMLGAFNFFTQRD